MDENNILKFRETPESREKRAQEISRHIIDLTTEIYNKFGDYHKRLLTLPKLADVESESTVLVEDLVEKLDDFVFKRLAEISRILASDEYTKLRDDAIQNKDVKTEKILEDAWDAQKKLSAKISIYLDHSPSDAISLAEYIDVLSIFDPED